MAAKTRLREQNTSAKKNLQGQRILQKEINIFANVETSLVNQYDFRLSFSSSRFIIEMGQPFDAIVKNSDSLAKKSIFFTSLQVFRSTTDSTSRWNLKIRGMVLVINNSPTPVQQHHLLSCPIISKTYNNLTYSKRRATFQELRLVFSPVCAYLSSSVGVSFLKYYQDPSAMAPNNLLSTVGSQFFPDHHIHKERESIWKGGRKKD